MILKKTLFFILFLYLLESNLFSQYLEQSKVFESKNITANDEFTSVTNNGFQYVIGKFNSNNFYFNNVSNSFNYTGNASPTNGTFIFKIDLTTGNVVNKAFLKENLNNIKVRFSGDKLILICEGNINSIYAPPSPNNQSIQAINSSTATNNYNDIFTFILSQDNLSLQQQMRFGGSDNELLSDVKINGNNIYYIGTTNSSNFLGNTDNNKKNFIVRTGFDDSQNPSINFTNYSSNRLGSSFIDYNPSFDINSTNLVVAHGVDNAGSKYVKLYYLNPTNLIEITTNSLTQAFNGNTIVGYNQVYLKNNAIILTGTATAVQNMNTQLDIYVAKFNSTTLDLIGDVIVSGNQYSNDLPTTYLHDNDQLYVVSTSTDQNSKTISQIQKFDCISAPSLTYTISSFGEANLLKKDGNILYIAGHTAYDFDGNPQSSGKDVFVKSYDANTGIEGDFYTRLIGSDDEFPTQLEITSLVVHVVGTSKSVSSFPSTNFLQFAGNKADVFYTALNKSSREIHYSTLLGGNSNEMNASMNILNNNKVALIGTIRDYELGNFPRAENPSTIPQGYADNGFYYTRLNLCADNFQAESGITPTYDQTTCKLGLANRLDAPKVVAMNLPVVYKLSSQLNQVVEAKYKWYKDGASNIISSTQLYTPTVGEASVNYYRIALKPDICGGLTILTSPMYHVIVDENYTAPQITLSSSPEYFTVCDGGNLTISANVQFDANNLASYEYYWDNENPTNGNSSVLSITSSKTLNNINNNVVNFFASSIHTNASGTMTCNQSIQKSIRNIDANAGENQQRCSPTETTILIGNNYGDGMGEYDGGGTTTILYEWKNDDDAVISNTPVCLIPENASWINSNSEVLTYTIKYFYNNTSNIPTCQSITNVEIKSVPEPLPNFAGEDIIYCISNDIAPTIGLPSNGYVYDAYAWYDHPEFLVNATGVPQTQLIDLNSIDPSYPNPMKFYLEVGTGRCHFKDSVNVTFLNAVSGSNTCGVTLLGSPENYVNLTPLSDDEPVGVVSYQWTSNPPTALYSGETEPVAVAYPSVNDPVSYTLTVNYNGQAACVSQATTVYDCEDPTYTSGGGGSGGGTPSSSSGTISVNPEVGCAAINPNNPTILTANPPNSGLYSYTWYFIEDDNNPNNDPDPKNFSTILGGYEVVPNTNNQKIRLISSQQSTLYCDVTSLLIPSISYTYQITIIQNHDFPTITTQSYAQACKNDIKPIGHPDNNQAYNYFWRSATTGESLDFQNGTNFNSYNPEVKITESMDVLVRVTDELGCVSNFESTIVVKEINYSAGNDFVFCGQLATEIGNPNNPDGYTFEWIQPIDADWGHCSIGDQSCVDDDQIEIHKSNPFVTLNATADYILKITDPSSQCVTYDTVHVTKFNPTGTPSSFDILDLAVCHGVQVTLRPEDLLTENGYSFSWNGPTNNGSNSTICNCQATTLTPPSNATNEQAEEFTYILTVTIAGQAGCSLIGDEKVTVNKPTNFDLDDISFCPSTEELTLGIVNGINKVPQAPGASYIWTPAPPTISPSNSFSANPELILNSVQNPITYNLQYTNQFECKSNAQTTLTPVASSPVAGMFIQTCKGEPVIIGSSNNEQNVNIVYQWEAQNPNHLNLLSGGVNPLSNPNPIFSSGIVGNYIFTLKKNDQGDSYDCITENNVTVSVTQPAVPIFAPINGLVCVNNEVFLDVINEINGTYSYTSSIIDNIVVNGADAYVSPIENTTYNVTVTDLNGCSNQGSITIFVDPHEAPVITFAQEPIEFCVNAGYPLLNPLITPNAPYLYQWTGGAVSNPNSIPVNALTSNNASYMLKVINSSTGCNNSEVINVILSNDCSNNCSLSIQGPNLYVDNHNFIVYAIGNPTGGSYTWNLNGATTTTQENYYIVEPSGTNLTLSVTYQNEQSECTGVTAQVVIPFDPSSCDFSGFEISDNSKCQGVPQQFTPFSTCTFSPNVQYAWDFGDGSAISNEAVPSHIYQQTGTYVCSLRVVVDYQNGNGPISLDPFVKTITINECEFDCKECIPSFEPTPGKYYISAWVKEKDAGIFMKNYTRSAIEVSFDGDPTIVNLMPKGQIIDGWQRIEGEIVVPNDPTAGPPIESIKLKFLTTATEAYFDDIRFFPSDASMMSYVYDPINLRLVAELDERNYATKYEYDEEGKLVRVKKETEKGVMTIKENRDKLIKRN